MHYNLMKLYLLNMNNDTAHDFWFYITIMSLYKCNLIIIFMFYLISSWFVFEGNNVEKNPEKC